jgi:hypothetical protein
VQTAEPVQAFLDQLARALTSGDTVRVGTMWCTPAFVIGDEMTKVVANREEIERFFGDAKSEYERQGITDTRAEIQGVQWLSDCIAIVSVRWPWMDASRSEVGSESSTYVLRKNEAGELKVCVSIAHGEAAPETH